MGAGGERVAFLEISCFRIGSGFGVWSGICLLAVLIVCSCYKAITRS